MFDDFSIVTTAVSSFNNAALFGACFFATGLLCLPLFYFARLYAGDILAHLNWKKDIEKKIGFWGVFTMVFWMLIFGGNYAVIRDGISLLPLIIAFVLFFSFVYITKSFIELNYLTFFNDKKIKWLTAFVLVMLTIVSAKPDLYGILLQLSAVVCGIIVGSRFHKNISDICWSVLIFGTVTVLILMQPEYFRFGQLGNLTMIHLAALLFVGFFAITALVGKYAKARSKIHESAYIKLKWLFRILAALALVLFALTESVPVFVGLLFVVGLSEILTIYHSKQISGKMYKQSWALLLFSFGVIITCPVISCLGILYMSTLTDNIKIQDFTRLL